MADRDSAGASGRLALPAELVLQDPSPSTGRVIAAALAAGIAIGWGLAALALHEHELALRSAGAMLNPLGTLFADASTPLTAWPGWAAAAILGLSAIRLRRDGVEPPAGHGSAGAMSAEVLRSGLRREYTGVRWALLAMGLLTLADLSRLACSGIAALLRQSGAGDGLAWMGAEAAGLVAATAALTIWVVSFRGQLEQVGALPTSGAPGQPDTDPPGGDPPERDPP
jgi:hypothetical protein